MESRSDAEFLALITPDMTYADEAVEILPNHTAAYKAEFSAGLHLLDALVEAGTGKLDGGWFALQAGR